MKCNVVQSRLGQGCKGVSKFCIHHIKENLGVIHRAGRGGATSQLDLPSPTALLRLLRLLVRLDGWCGAGHVPERNDGGGYATMCERL